jgi:hypothetical protein
MSGRIYQRSLNVAEPRPAYLQSRVHLESNVTNLGADMLALTIAVGPNEENSGTPGMGLNVARNGFLVLKSFSSQCRKSGVELT